MINILVKVKDDVIIYLLANGHAISKNNVNVVCSSFSFILRTFFSVLDLEGEVFIVKNSKRGYLEFKPFFKDLSRESLFYYSRFLIRGINDLCFEYPNDIKLVLEEN
ncbi:ribosomal-processing cysteine protease Prp [Borreliella bavariensis]|uniref:ribosomal-processing cysteine protease Prp n=1 Tax=Borreliella bavariensis TaxID=664662 RepID=UPI001C0065ED|nr:ribosomal-processing cysteine protease Prp [Borreliella bavariensis]